MEYFEENPKMIPDNIKVTVIPNLNPDGLDEVYGTTGEVAQSDVITDRDVTVAGRFNSNEVDLNRNFDCNWKEKAVWRSRTVSGGDKPFSESESRAIRDYVESHDIAAAVAWFSASNGVFGSSCGGVVAADTKALVNVYAVASGYEPNEIFDAYEINGDMVNWFAKNDIPAISVLLADYESSELSKNRKGIEAMLNYYAE